MLCVGRSVGLDSRFKLDFYISTWFLIKYYIAGGARGVLALRRLADQEPPDWLVMLPSATEVGELNKPYCISNYCFLVRNYYQGVFLVLRKSGDSLAFVAGVFVLPTNGRSNKGGAVRASSKLIQLATSISY